MTAERDRIRDFLSSHHPFDALSADALGSLAEQIEILDAPRTHVILRPGHAIRHLYLVESGGVELLGPGGQVWAYCSEGESFGVRALLADGLAPYHAIAHEDSRVYLLPDTAFTRLMFDVPEIDRYFNPLGAQQLGRAKAVESIVAGAPINLIAERARDVMVAPPAPIEPRGSIRDAARAMREQGTAWLPVVQNGTLEGVVTDEDLRNRAVAEGLDVNAPISTIMTKTPIAIAPSALAFDALMPMIEKGLSHLPVVDAGGSLLGAIERASLARRDVNSAISMVGNVYMRETPTALAESVSQIPHLLVILVDMGVAVAEIGQIITSISDAATYRLLQLAERRLGAPPVPYVWLASGSQARQEQTGKSDQDNCMIIDDAYDEAKHGAYFKELAHFVCDGLDACGYVYCPGEMMAMTPKWRQPLRQWRKYFHSWIEQPEPMAQMLSSVMFDLRSIRGATELFDELQRETLERARNNSIYLAHMVSNALTHTPPIGFFRNFVLIRGGEHRHQLDLKLSGVVPIIDIARVYALKAADSSVTTEGRLRSAQRARVLSQSGASDLLNAFELLSTARLKNQVRQIQSGRQPDNFIDPHDLSRAERSRLREAFLVVKSIQANMANAHQIRAR